MSGVSTTVLNGNALERWRRRYAYLRDDRDANAVVALLGAIAYAFACMLFRFESRSWQFVLRHWHALFAHIGEPRIRAGDPLRYLIQLLWLGVVRPVRPVTDGEEPAAPRRRPLADRLSAWTARLSRQTAQSPQQSASPPRPQSRPVRLAIHGLYAMVGLLTTGLVVLCITAPFYPFYQALFAVMLWCLALILRRIPGRVSTLTLIVLSVTVSCRYLWWRYTSTLHWDDWMDAFFGGSLIAAETYAWLVLVLSYLQSIWPLNRDPAPLPADTADWPTVDVYIPTYNEDLSVVRPTVFAAMGLDWPSDKLRIYILDDGRREALREFAAEVGVEYLTRPDNRHAKSGNLNHALTKSDGELLAIFDCDHIPSRSFLQMTVGWLVQDRRLALVQTPHHFYSPDPFERNLGGFRSKPNENILFYGLIQNGNDTWDAAFFCGSCAVLRRSAIESIGGFATETVTEDAHTSLRLHRKGYTAAYIRIPQAAGLATESLSAHIGQRMRWARGLVQIFRLDNPLTGKGLSLVQRLCYGNAMLHFLSGIPRLVFMVAPLAYLFLHAYIIYAPATVLLLYVIPHLAHASLTNAHIQGVYRRTFWGEMYETVLAWYIAWPTTVALFNPLKGKFNVTAKGGLVENNYYDWYISRPYIFLAFLNFGGLGVGLWRCFYGPPMEVGTVIVSMCWLFYNLIILGAAAAVASEVRQMRRTHRVEVALPAMLRLESGHLLPCRLTDYSEGGVAVETREPGLLEPGQPLSLILRRGRLEYVFQVAVTRAKSTTVGLMLQNMTPQDHIDFVQCTFARADMWVTAQSRFSKDSPLIGLVDIVRMALLGYRQLAQHAPAPFSHLLRAVSHTLGWFVSFAPRNISISKS